MKEKKHRHLSEYLLLCFTEEIKSCRFEMTWGWINNGRIFIFQWTIALMWLTSPFLFFLHFIVGYGLIFPNFVVQLLSSFSLSFERPKIMRNGKYVTWRTRLHKRWVIQSSHPVRTVHFVRSKASTIPRNAVWIGSSPSLTFTLIQSHAHYLRWITWLHPWLALRVLNGLWNLLSALFRSVHF